MTTILESPPQISVIPDQVQKQTVPTPTPTPPPTKRHLTAAIVVAVVALVAALAALALTLGHTTTTTAPTTGTPVAGFPFDAYGPGSSTYVGQVPALVSAEVYNAMRNTALYTAYGPGTTLYGEQVPSLASDYVSGQLVDLPVPHGTMVDRTVLVPGLQGSTYSEWPPAPAPGPVPTDAPNGAAPLE